MSNQTQYSDIEQAQQQEIDNCFAYMQGVWIPREIWLDKSLTLVQKCFLVEIKNLSRDGHDCYASNQHFADFLQVSKSSVSRSLSDLIARGYVKSVVQRIDKSPGTIRYLKVDFGNLRKFKPEPEGASHDDNPHQKINKNFESVDGGLVKETRGYLQNNKRVRQIDAQSNNNKSNSKNNNNNILSSSANDDATPAEQTELLSSQPKKPTANLSQRDQTKATSDKQELYQAVIDYLNQYTGKHYRSTTKATQRLINGRVKEGATLADFKHVITVKCRQWQGTSMQQYLRPSTLFSPQHFEEYAQEPLQDLPVKNGRKVIEKLPEWAQQPAATQPSVQAASTNDKDKARLAKERKALLAQLRPAQ